MSALTDALRAIIDKPDDLSQLPGIIAQVQEIESKEFDYQTRIKSLQDANYAYLKQIPIAGMEPKEEPKAEAPPTLDDAKESIINALLGGKPS